MWNFGWKYILDQSENVSIIIYNATNLDNTPLLNINHTHGQNFKKRPKNKEIFFKNGLKSCNLDLVFLLISNLGTNNTETSKSFKLMQTEPTNKITNEQND